MKMHRIIYKVCFMFLLCMVSASVSVFAAGPTTHDEIAQRTVAEINQAQYPSLVQLLQNHAADNHIGSVFPDWAYAILNIELALATHSSAFRQSYETYVQDHFPPPYTYVEERQVGFLMGVVDHQTSDNHWHPYFLAQAIQQDNSNEEVIELGVDIFTIWEQGQLGHSDAWWVPMRTVLSVYYQMGYTNVTQQMIIDGLRTMRAGMYAEQNMTYFTYLLYLALLPWTHSNYMTYVPGGILDDATASADENQITWDNIQGLGMFGYQPYFVQKEEKSVIFEIGRELLRSGKVRVPVEYLEDGNVIIGEPELVGEMETGN